MPETALVTGGAGFIGAHVVDRLLHRGWNVHATSRRTRHSDSDRLVFHRGELSNLDFARSLLRTTRPDVVCHLAGSVGAAPDCGLVLETFHSHVTSAINLMTLLEEGGLPRRLVIAGSPLEPTGDTAVAVPSSPYAAAKIAATLYARMFDRLYGTPVVIARPFMTYGPGQHSSKVLPYVIRSLSEGRSPELSSGAWRADWIYVADVVDGLVAAMTVEGVEGAQVDLGTGSLKSVREVVTELHGLMKTEVPLNFQGRDDRPPPPELTADVAETKRLLHWEPKVGLTEGLTATIDWYRAHRE